MTIGEHITFLRKKKHLSQSDLGKAIGTSGDIIGRYERGLTTPSIEVIINIADTLEVSIDFLVGKSSVEVDKQTLKRLEEIQHLPEPDRNSLLLTIDNFIKATKLKAL